MNTLTTDDTEVRLFIFGSADVEKPVALWVVSDDDTTVAVPLTVQRARHLGELLLAHVAAHEARPSPGGVL